MPHYKIRYVESSKGNYYTCADSEEEALGNAKRALPSAELYPIQGITAIALIEHYIELALDNICEDETEEEIAEKVSDYLKDLPGIDHAKAYAYYKAKDAFREQ